MAEQTTAELFASYANELNGDLLDETFTDLTEQENK